MVSGLQSLGLDFELRDAVDGQNFPPEYEALVDRSAYRRAGRPIRMGSIANWLSQRQAFLEMVEDGPEIMAVLEANPLIRDGIDRSLARYWHHGLATYCLRPAVVGHGPQHEEIPSLIAQAPVQGALTAYRAPTPRPGTRPLRV